MFLPTRHSHDLIQFRNVQQPKPCRLLFFWYRRYYFSFLIYHLVFHDRRLIKFIQAPFPRYFADAALELNHQFVLYVRDTPNVEVFTRIISGVVAFKKVTSMEVAVRGRSMLAQKLQLWMEISLAQRRAFNIL